MEDEPETEPNEEGPLSGTRILAFTHMMSGPMATMVLSDLGADVIKIEPPEGDISRDKPLSHAQDAAFGSYFLSLNRNKRSLVVDLKTEEGKEVVRELVTESDALIENYRSGTMDRLGLSYEELREINPGLVYASIRGFGDPRTGESPYTGFPAWDPVAQAMGGLMSITGTEDIGPLKAGPGIGDIYPALLTAIGVLSALRHRDQTGEGQYVDVGMIDSVMAMTERIIYQYSIGNETPGPQGISHPLLFPFGRYDAKDGYVVIAAVTDDQWSTLCEHIGRPEWAEEYASDQERLDDKEFLRSTINEWSKQHTKKELFDKLGGKIAIGPVYDAEDIFEDPHFEAREMLTEVDYADTDETATIPSSPIKLTETPARKPGPAPFLGEDSNDVLSELGYSTDEISELVENGVIGSESQETESQE